MTRNAFYSFQYQADNWRASQVRNMGVVEGNKPASDNDWETVTSGGDAAIRRWIDAQLAGRSVVVVLIGSRTAGRKWVDYEIEKGWKDGKGVLGIYIHNLKDVNEKQATKGGNPFGNFTVNGKSLSSIVRTYDPPFSGSSLVYAHIRESLADWIEEAIEIRERYR